MVGTGGFGVVYRGKIKVNGCESDYVAMKKFLHDHKLMDRDDHQKSQKVLQKEAEFLGSFSHQNIIQFKGACFDYPHLCIVMEYAGFFSFFLFPFLFFFFLSFNFQKKKKMDPCFIILKRRIQSVQED